MGEEGHACTTTVEKGMYKTIPSLHCVRLIKNIATLFKESFMVTSRGNIETTSTTSRGQLTRATEVGFVLAETRAYRLIEKEKEEYWTEKIIKDSLRRMY